MKYTYLESLMLTKYFGLRSLVGEEYIHRRALFDKLSAIYHITKAKSDNLFQLTEREEISSITRYEDYSVTVRALDYRERFGLPVILTEDIIFALKCKGQGLRATHEFIKDCGKSPTAPKIKTCVLSQKHFNNINVAFFVAFLYYEGIIFSKDKDKAKKYAEKCMRWNNIDGLLLLLYYEKQTDSSDYLSVLYTIVRHMDAQEEFSGIFSHYKQRKISCCQDALLIANYLDCNMEAADTFDSVVSKIAMATFISLGDRTRLLESGDRFALGQVSDIALSKEAMIMKEVAHLREYVSSERENEANQIEICLRKQGAEQIKVPMLVCRDNIALRFYATALRKFYGENTVYIDSSTCTGGCFAPTKGNLIIKNLISHNTCNAAFIFGGVSEIGESDVEELSILLSPINRGAYSLQDANIMLDLSGCAFILLADSEEIPTALERVCQKIIISPATKEEAEGYVEAVILENKTLYDCPNLMFRHEAISCLAKYDVTHINTLVGAICRQHSFEAKDSFVGKEDVNKMTAQASRPMAFNIGI